MSLQNSQSDLPNFESAGSDKQENVTRFLANFVNYNDLAFLIKNIEDDPDRNVVLQVLENRYRDMFENFVPCTANFFRAVAMRMSSIMQSSVSQVHEKRIESLMKIARKISLLTHSPMTGDLFVGLGTVTTAKGTWNPYEDEMDSKLLQIALGINVKFDYNTEHFTEEYDSENIYHYHGPDCVVLSCVGNTTAEDKEYMLPRPTPNRIDPNDAARAIRFAVVEYADYLCDHGFTYICVPTKVNPFKSMDFETNSGK